MAKDWKAQVMALKEENLRLTLEVQNLKDRMDEAVNQARRDEAVRICQDILEMRGK